MNYAITTFVGMTMAAAALAAEPPAGKAIKPRSRDSDAPTAPAKEQTVAELITALKDPKLATRRQAANQLGGLGTRRPPPCRPWSRH